MFKDFPIRITQAETNLTSAMAPSVGFGKSYVPTGIVFPCHLRLNILQTVGKIPMGMESGGRRMAIYDCQDADILKKMSSN